MSQSSASKLVLIMTCGIFIGRPLPKSMQADFLLDPTNKTQENRTKIKHLNYQKNINRSLLLDILLKFPRTKWIQSCCYFPVNEYNTLPLLVTPLSNLLANDVAISTSHGAPNCLNAHAITPPTAWTISHHNTGKFGTVLNPLRTVSETYYELMIHIYIAPMYTFWGEPTGHLCIHLINVQSCRPLGFLCFQPKWYVKQNVALRWFVTPWLPCDVTVVKFQTQFDDKTSTINWCMALNWELRIIYCLM